MGELRAAGFQLGLTLTEGATLHIHRRRLPERERVHVLATTGATHIVGDDPLSPSRGQWGPPLANLWKYTPQFAWGDSAHSHPLVLFPEELGRLRERVDCELKLNSHAVAVTVLVTMPRPLVDGMPAQTGTGPPLPQKRPLPF